MRSAVRLSFAVLLAWSLQFSLTAPARADTAVASLGVRSLDGENDLERRLSSALRNAASAIAGWSVGRREASLEQMSLAHGCDEPDSRCLADIARTLAVDVLLYGTVLVTPSSSAGSYELTVYRYDASEKRVRSAELRSLRAAQLKGAAAKEALLSLLSRLSTEEPPAPPASGQLRIQGDLPGARISVDGEPRGTLDERGMLTLELAPGKHVVRAAGSSLAPAEEEVAVVEAGETAQLELHIAPARVKERPPALALPPVEDEPQPKPARSLRRIFGWVSLGVSAAFAVATVYSWVRIEKINDDPDFLAYRGAFPRAGTAGGVGNVCPAADRGELAAREPSRAGLERQAKSLCDEADRLQTLQYVFLGGTLVGGGLATYLLLTSRPERHTDPVLSFGPRLGRGSAALEARLRF